MSLLTKSVVPLLCFVSAVSLTNDVPVDREKERLAKLDSAEPLRRSNRPLIGAIRWDGCGNNCEIGKDSERVLGLAKYQHRAPFFVAAAGSDFIKFKPLSQEIMDTEIGFDIHAGIDYWAFDWYPPGDGMELARNLFLLPTNGSVSSGVSFLGRILST